MTPEAQRIMQQQQKGFSLIELLVVVAIILIIASISILNLLRSKMTANEASAAVSLRTAVALRRCWLSDVGSLDRGRHQSLDLSPTTRKLVRIYLARTFTFDGMADQAGAALQRAGFPHYSMGENSGMDEYRSSGSFFTGAGGTPFAALLIA